jgi:protein arginine N-methyltransferase 1
MSIEFHRRMLADDVRHVAFRAAFERVLKRGRSTVADIGAGTGVLAFFARELGAREVWLYDPGAALALAELVAARNGIDGLHFVPERSLDVQDPPQVDVVVAEVLGNFAYEEGVLETLRDARRFLAPGGALIPQSIVQWAAPVASDRFERDFRTWRSVGHGLDWSDAERVTRNNMYVFAIEPNDLLGAAPASWDALEFSGDIDSKREGRVSWTLTSDATIFGFALWWECTLVPGVVLSTSPFAARTHWDQIYLPLLEAIDERDGRGRKRHRRALDGRAAARGGLRQSAGARYRQRLSRLARAQRSIPDPRRQTPFGMTPPGVISSMACGNTCASFCVTIG